ncbi:MAG TPA: hypothetical protein VHI53_14315 [Gaiellaceae bacterium]|jgi:hypothetical protein|nr:hypothetical protein [Gaiellaceae bacterium]
MPEVASEPENEIPTEWLYQSFASGPRPGDPPTDGGVASRRTITVVVREPSAFDHVQDTPEPLVSDEIVAGPQPVAITPGGGALHVTVTSLVCQS